MRFPDTPRSRAWLLLDRLYEREGNTPRVLRLDGYLRFAEDSYVEDSYVEDVAAEIRAALAEAA